MDRSRPKAWTQEALLGGGYEEVMVEFTVHLRRGDDTVIVGCELSEPSSREPIAITTKLHTGHLLHLEELSASLLDALVAARLCLQPF